MTTPYRRSPSQIAAFRDCQRKWAWAQIAGIRHPSNASAELGTETHGQLETYLSGGNLDFTKESGEIAASGLEHLPLPGTAGMRLEVPFSFFGPSGQEYMGYKDVEITPPPGGVPLVIDHKTTSDLKWAKRPKDLLTDPQAVLYAVDAFIKNPEATCVDLKWIYYQTKRTRKSQATYLRVLPEEIHRTFLDIETTAHEMGVLQESITNPLDLPPSTDHCSAYGGCSYQGNCNLSPIERMRSTVSQGVAATSSLLTKMKEQRERDRAAREGAAPPAINPPEWQPPPVSAEVRDAAKPSQYVTTGVLLSGPVTAPILPVTATAAAVVATSAPVEAPKRGRGRPKKVTAADVQTGRVVVPPGPGVNEAMTAAVARREDSTIMSHEDSEEVRRLVALHSPSAATKKIGILFVDCGPVGVAVADAYTFILAGKTRLAAGGVEDYRLVKFGEGAGMLAVATAKELDTQLGHLPYVRIDSHSPEGNVVLSTFIDRAEMVVR